MNATPDPADFPDDPLAHCGRLVAPYDPLAGCGRLAEPDDPFAHCGRLVEFYSPDQPRDSYGRWVGPGGVREDARARPPGVPVPGKSWPVGASALPHVHAYLARRNIYTATQYALNVLGIKTVRLGQDVDMANRVLAPLAAFKAAGLPMPDGIVIDAAQFSTRPGVAASYDRGDRTIYVNPSDPIWTDPRMRQRLHARGYFSSADPHGTMCHEFGHFLHHHFNEAKYLSAPTQKADFARAIAETGADVSRYARDNARNFVAEVFVVLATGGSFANPNVLKWYDYFGGKRP